jgi:hypothetical protein
VNGGQKLLNSAFSRSAIFDLAKRISPRDCHVSSGGALLHCPRRLSATTHFASATRPEPLTARVYRPPHRAAQHPNTSHSMLRTAASRLAGAVSSKSNAFASASTRSFVAAKLPDLAYDYGALEPVISAQIMETHHAKHHNTYVNNFNIAMEKYEAAEAKGDYPAMIALQGAIKFNGGGKWGRRMLPQAREQRLAYRPRVTASAP